MGQWNSILHGDRGAMIAIAKVKSILIFILLCAFLSNVAGCTRKGGGFINWEPVGGELEKAEVMSLAFSQLESSLFVGTNQRGIWRYHEMNWMKLGDELDNASIFSLVEGGRGNLLYAAAGEAGVWRYQDDSWKNTAFPDAAYTLALDERGGRLYAASNREVWALEADAWRSWGKLPVMRIYSIYYWEDEDLLLAGTDDGLWACAGQIWIRYGEKLKGEKVRSLVGEGKGGFVYAGTEHDGIWRGHGQEWEKLTEKTFSSAVYCLYYEPLEGFLFAGTEYGVWVYEGNEWMDSSGSIKELDITSIAFDASDMRLWVGAFQDRGVWCGDTSRIAEVFAEREEKNR